MSRPLFQSGSLKSSASGLSRGTTLATDNFSHSLQLPVAAPVRTDPGLNTDHVAVKTDRHGHCIYVDSEERQLAGADEDWMCCHCSTEFLQSTRAPTLNVPNHRGLSLLVFPLVLCPLVICAVGGIGYAHLPVGYAPKLNRILRLLALTVMCLRMCDRHLHCRLYL